MAGGDVDSVADPADRCAATAEHVLSRDCHACPMSGGELQLGMRGKAKLYTGWQPLSRRLYRFLTRTFHFEL